MMGRGKQKSFANKYGYHIVIGGFVAVCVISVLFVLAQKTIDTKTTPKQRASEDGMTVWTSCSTPGVVTPTRFGCARNTRTDMKDADVADPGRGRRQRLNSETDEAAQQHDGADLWLNK